MWYLVIIVLIGSFSTDVKWHSLNMNNKDACIAAMIDIKKTSSKHIGVICVSADTGEIIR